MTELTLPRGLQAMLAGQPYSLDSTGMSGASIALYEDKVLKIQPVSRETRTEAAMLRWLEGRLPAPRCLYRTEENGVQYLLMTRLRGEMACAPSLLEDPAALVSSLAEALRRLWETPIAGCPAVWMLDEKLAAAREAVERGAVDMDNVEPETFGPGGFSGPSALLEWLCGHRPPEEPVLSHGDFCLPNLFFENGRLSGYLDLGRMGVADRWQDIALCYRSLRHNYDGTYSGAPRRDFDPNSLFAALGIEPDWDKIRYYLLLDELF